MTLTQEDEGDRVAVDSRVLFEEGDGELCSGVLAIKRYVRLSPRKSGVRIKKKVEIRETRHWHADD